MRVAVALPLLAGASLIATQQLGAQVFPGHDTDAPVDYAADRIELQDKQNRVVLTGNVDIKQTDLRLRAARTVVNFTNADELKLQRITASGGVTVTRGNEVATGDTAIYDFNKRIITMIGNASLKRDSDTLRGGRFVIDLKSGVSSASGGRVSGTFSVPKQN
ncbi:OstA family protein [Novosphingobium pentaromativorans US6-1]|uniref:OstA-like protein n=2 Tax=Novosphingobium pentaromativorans TaxID=205844 RepID=G6EBR6_9SPHN|nr:OstA family protein [Novosphingobium pentaromativorans US6-1]EHJ61348.1 OstA-like protein [Novosphingobium pentaromativorans US6-1]